jgi:A/G-specific adenine glycosylase
LENSSFAFTLISWYQENKRNLPWRDTVDPYKLWLAEIILQQTRVAQGLPYYYKFCNAFPTIDDLANAPEQSVLRLWQGLGYYSRARNLHRCAQVIVSQYNGIFPHSYQELITLPGIGDYTASAIASFAFGLPTPVVDGNVFRVLSRVFGVKDDISLQRSRKVFRDLSLELMGDAPPDQFNQAIMEFGALHCTPGKPKCLDCPFNHYCQAYKLGKQNEFPVKSKRTNVRQRFFYYFVLKSGSCVLMKKRQPGDIWQGLYDFMLVEPELESDPFNLLAEILPISTSFDQLIVNEPSSPYSHKLTHQLIRARFIQVELPDSMTLAHWKKRLKLDEFEVDQIHHLPKPILIDNYLKAHLF